MHKILQKIAAIAVAKEAFALCRYAFVTYDKTWYSSSWIVSNYLQHWLGFIRTWQLNKKLKFNYCYIYIGWVMSNKTSLFASTHQTKILIKFIYKSKLWSEWTLQNWIKFIEEIEKRTRKCSRYFCCEEKNISNRQINFDNQLEQIIKMVIFY